MAQDKNLRRQKHCFSFSSSDEKEREKEKRVPWGTQERRAPLFSLEGSKREGRWEREREAKLG